MEGKKGLHDSCYDKKNTQGDSEIVCILSTFHREVQTVLVCFCFIRNESAVCCVAMHSPSFPFNMKE